MAKRGYILSLRAAAILIAMVMACAGEATAGTSTVTVTWGTGNESCVCGGDFACAGESSDWDGGMKPFADPVPAGGTVTGISVGVFAVVGCGGIPDLDVEVQGTTVEERTLPPSDLCECGECSPNTFAGTSVGGWPGYNYGGTNTLFLNLKSGDICADRAEITLTWEDTCGNGTIEPYETCDDGNTTNGDGCSAACQVEPCYACSGQPSTCSPLPDGSDCDDGLFCNGTDTCSSAACTIHTGNPCAGGPDCNNLCDETHDSCLSTFGSPCTDDGNLCTDDECDGMGACVHPDNFGPCDDGVFCNGSDFCASGSCVIHDGDPCVFTECSRMCDEMAGACDPDMAGTPCSDDGLVCTNDQCDGMGFCAHPPLPGGTLCPDDGNVCTNDECDGIGLCVHPTLPNGTACDDSNACTQTDRCQSGQCVGADPIICTAPACRQVGTCDPSTGTCSSCPAGYTPGEGGCQKTYAIDASLLDNQFPFCDSANQYNGCGATPFGFHWRDTGDAGVGDVTRVDVEIETGIDCSGNEHTVTLNTTSIGIYTATAGCLCDPLPMPVPKLLTDVDPSTYAKGGSNSVSIDAVGCAGLSQDAQGDFALVTATYEYLGAPIAIQSSCRHAAKSKFKYDNRANDARDKVAWKWVRGAATSQADLSNPTTSADYQFCVYAETTGAPALLIGAEVPASASLWSAVRDVGYQYTDKTASHDGMRQILVKGGAAGKSKIIVNGKGAALGDPTLPLPPATDIRVQLTNASSGVCWESEFPVSAITGGINGKAR